MPNEFEALRDRLRDFARARGWERAHTPRNLALALMGEVGELAAELQWIPDDRVGAYLDEPAAHVRLAAEAADVLIYLIRLADVCEIDLLQETNAKIDINDVRFPAPAAAQRVASQFPVTPLDDRFALGRARRPHVSR